MADRTTDLRIRRSRAHRYLDEERLSAKSKFTGKEEDTEVGLTYFGARYYHARLGRFISADPLAVHTTRGDPNPYAYVRGRVFAATDPFGLDGKSTGTFTIPEVTIVGPSPAKTALQGARPVIIDAVSIAARAFGTSASTLSAFNMRQTQVTVSIIKSTLNASIPWRSTDDVVAKHIQNQTPMPGSAAAFAQGLGHGYMSKCASSSPIPIGRHVASDMGARIGTPPEDDVAGAIGTDIGNILPEAMAAAGGSVTTALDEAIAKQAIAGATAAAAEGTAARSVGAAESSYSVAANGGRNAGFLRHANRWSTGQLQRAEASYQAQIEIHEAKIADPARYAADWMTRNSQAQEGLLHHWGKEISNFSQQQSIVQEILFRRGL